jgi:hypothetical protein
MKRLKKEKCPHLVNGHVIDTFEIQVKINSKLDGIVGRVQTTSASTSAR